jgi:hypothetical protein
MTLFMRHKVETTMELGEIQLILLNFKNRQEEQKTSIHKEIKNMLMGLLNKMMTSKSLL